VKVSAQPAACLFVSRLILFPIELQSQRDSISKLREELRKARSDNDELSLRYDDEVYNGAAWKKERERLETKIADLSRAYDSSIAAQTEQQSQIVALHSQARELRSVLNDAEADRALLQKARRGLQAELETIKIDTVDATRIKANASRRLEPMSVDQADAFLKSERDKYIAMVRALNLQAQ